MSGVLLISLVMVVTASDRFLRETGKDLVQDQDRVATAIVEQSVQALERQGEQGLSTAVRDKARQLDESFEAIERIVNLEAASAERLLSTPEEAKDVSLIESAAFADPARRPKDFQQEPGKNRRVALGEVLWHRAPSADPVKTAESLLRLKGLGFTMRALYKDNPLSAWIYLGTEDGLYFGYPADDSIEKSYDHRARDWYLQARAKRGMVWSRPYLDPSGALLLTCSRPFYRGEALAGVVAVDVTIDQINALIGELQSGLHGYAFLLDETGHISVSPDTQEGGGAPHVFASDNLLGDEDPAVVAVATKMVGRQSGLAQLDRATGRNFLGYAHIPSTGWSLGVMVPEEEIVAPARQHEAALQELFRAGTAHIGVRVDEARRKFGMWGMFFVLFLLLGTTGFVFVRLTRPIKGFIRDIAIISRGNLEHRVLSATENELGDLAAAFNDMTSELKRSRDQIEEYSRNLERKVEARTAELASSNSELADAIRKLQDAQSRLVHSEKMASLGQLVAGIAHEINNPVNFIANSVAPLQEALGDFAKIVEMRKGGATIEEIDEYAGEVGLDDAIDQMRKALELIKTGSTRTKAIVLQLRNFSRLDEAEMKDADVHEGIDGSLALLNYKVKDKIEVVREYGQVGRILCYPGQLNQVFMNILANAVHAIEAKKSDERGRILIKTRREDGKVIVQISDTGTGIPSSVMPKIFDPFFTTKDKERGTGLGLSISHGIVEKHGGRIDVRTEMGKGTEFVITLPIQVERRTKAG